jgi:predicted pyridoxine 5'-phosphate oxidase superfamily flavin-nucleotide-binding protein
VCGRIRAAVFFAPEIKNMTHRFADITFTDSVKSIQEHYGSRAQNDRLQNKFGPNDQLTARETGFIELRDTFYIASVSETGWPYVQHRGGPPGFLRVLGPNQLGYADFRGNTQLVSVGNLSKNDRCSLILMDYPNRHRLKLLGRMRVEDARSVSSEVIAQVELPDYKASIERVAFIDVVAYDWNCPQHITRRYTEAEFAHRESELARKIQETAK